MMSRCRREAAGLTRSRGVSHRPLQEPNRPSCGRRRQTRSQRPSSQRRRRGWARGWAGCWRAVSGRAQAAGSPGGGVAARGGPAGVGPHREPVPRLWEAGRRDRDRRGPRGQPRRATNGGRPLGVGGAGRAARGPKARPRGRREQLLKLPRPLPKNTAEPRGGRAGGGPEPGEHRPARVPVVPAAQGGHAAGGGAARAVHVPERRPRRAAEVDGRPPREPRLFHRQPGGRVRPQGAEPSDLRLDGRAQHPGRLGVDPPCKRGGARVGVHREQRPVHRPEAPGRARPRQAKAGGNVRRDPELFLGRGGAPTRALRGPSRAVGKAVVAIGG
mmetsp:Transcript_3014/g.6827  ORF Transcript_3014/g.6827 Transcript_3014/m.6827 type:complete len:329 (-) Transcript_3014:1086-2072(-)